MSLPSRCVNQPAESVVPFAMQIPRWAALAVVLVVSVATRADVVGAASCPKSPFISSPPLIIAHASSTYFGPPNTLVGMRAALKAGADALDADVRLTADGVLVASHDDTLDSFSTSKGSLRSTTLAQLKKLDAASKWKDPSGRFSLRGKGVRVPTIEEVLRAFPNRRISLEFKVTGGEKTMCDLLRKLKRTGDVWIGSAGDAAVDRFKPICPEVVTTVTDAMVVVMREVQRTGIAWCAPVPIGQPPFANGTRTFVTKKSVDWAREHGLASFTWTVDNPDDLDAAIRAGVDGIYTGRPDLARQRIARIRTAR
jgi:glycerophosphoryl diester phosphodiesterase